MGGALYKGSAANSIFTQNSAQNGGAAYESILTKSTFTRNTATEEGPAVYGGKLSSDCKFSSTEDIYNATFFEYGKTFADLNTLINNGNSNQINLNDDYSFNEALDYNFKKGISPTRAITINGNGHTIDGCEGARIFNINVNGVILKNIVFENAYVEGNGGAVLGNATVINCTFKNNRATLVYIDKITQEVQCMAEKP